MVSERQFLDFVAGVLEIPSADIGLDIAYESIPQWDSVMHLRLVMEIGAEFEVDIPIEEVPNLKTLASFYEYVRS